MASLDDEHHHCKICNCYVNGAVTWETHTKGKRHEKNVKKRLMFGPLSIINDAKEKVFGGESTKGNISDRLKDLLKDVKGTILGLDEIVEIDEFSIIPKYNCPFCSEELTAGTIGAHLVSSTHRINYRETQKQRERRAEKRKGDYQSGDEGKRRKNFHHT